MQKVFHLGVQEFNLTSSSNAGATALLCLSCQLIGARQSLGTLNVHCETTVTVDSMKFIEEASLSGF